MSVNEYPDLPVLSSVTAKKFVYRPRNEFLRHETLKVADGVDYNAADCAQESAK
jgi:hypothetical protein